MRHEIKHGVFGGLIGGIVFAGIMVVNGTLQNMGMLTLPLIGTLVGHPSAWVGFGVHMVNSAIIGAGYVLTLGRAEKGMIDGLHLGMIYGAIWWFLGPLTIMPMLLGEPLASRWSFDAALTMFPSLIGHVVFGVILGLTVGVFRDASLPVPERPAAGPGEAVPSEEETPADRSVFAEPPRIRSARPKGAADPRRVPLWMSMSLIFFVFLLNILIFGYASFTGGFPRAHEPHAAAAPAGTAPAAPAAPAGTAAPAETTAAPAATGH